MNLSDNSPAPRQNMRPPVLARHQASSRCNSRSRAKAPNASVAGSACHGFATACDPTRHFVLTFHPSSICSDMKAGSLGGRHEPMKTWTSGSGDVSGVQFGVGWRNEVLCLTIVRLFGCFYLSAFRLNHFLDPKRANGSFVYIPIVRREYERQTSSKSKLLQRVSSGHL